ncbi:hypothetical protein P167DRAFT_539603 [Morchella conica CCBAS932]|uniref:Uncharacterized protein n=1 Tax=Morchella conica CCBAS932 TaxID=1392247 RepID=A0A3N4KFG8_9PEZI|nr:hypothetical protein P167DRAFT_539603 [Morchella conica CCBAS932]
MSTLGQPPPISPPDIDPPSTTEAPPPCSTPPPPKPKVPPIPPPQYRWADTYLSSTPCNSWDILDYLRRSGDAGPFDKLVHSWVKALTALAKADGDGDATDEERAKAAELYARYDALVGVPFSSFSFSLLPTPLI